MAEPEFRFQKVGEENLGRFSEMFRRCFGLKLDAAYFRWKYLENPAGHVVAFEALDGDIPAAFYGVIPELYVVNGRVTTVYQSMDTATHPDYQRRGLFLKLATLTYEHIKREHGHLEMIGFPGPQSYGGFVNKLGWRGIHDIAHLFAPTVILKLRHLGRSTESVKYETVTSLTRELEVYLARRRPRAVVSKFWSAAVVDWRVFKHPLHKYELVVAKEEGGIIGHCVYRIDTAKSCRIEWAEFLDPALYARSVPALVAHLAKNGGTRYLYTWQPTDDVLRRGYKAAGLIRNRVGRGPFAGSEPYIVYAGPAADQAQWFDPASYDLQPLIHD